MAYEPYTNFIPAERAGELLMAAMRTIIDAGGSLRSSEMMGAVKNRVEITSWEETKTPSGAIRWQNAIQWRSVDAVRAGWLRKHDSVWSVTEEGKSALDLPLVEFVRIATERYQNWRNAQNAQKLGPPPRQPNAADLEEVRDFLDSVVGSVWWVNQGSTYDLELKGGYLWAPQKNRAGIALSHHTDLLKVEPGDIILHYANSALRAVSRTLERATTADRPGDFPGEAWDRAGYLLRTEYHQFS